MDFSKFINIELADRGAQASLAASQNFSASTISGWRKGRLPDFESCLKLAIHFKMDPKEIFEITGQEEYNRLYERFLPDYQPTVATEADLYSNLLHAKLHANLQTLIESGSEEEIERELNRLLERHPAYWKINDLARVTKAVKAAVVATVRRNRHVIMIKTGAAGRSHEFSDLATELREKSLTPSWVVINLVEDLTPEDVPGDLRDEGPFGLWLFLNKPVAISDEVFDLIRFYSYDWVSVFHLRSVQSFNFIDDGMSEDELNQVALRDSRPEQRVDDILEALDLGAQELGVPPMAEFETKADRHRSKIWDFVRTAGKAELSRLFKLVERGEFGKPIPLKQSSSWLTSGAEEVAEIADHDEPRPVHVIQVPYFADRVPAGPPTEVEPDGYRTVEVMRHLAKATRYAIRAWGDSMEPEIRSGDLLLVDYEKEAHSKDIVCVLLNRESMIKQLVRRGRGVYLRSFNEEYKEHRITPEDELKIQGVVIRVVDRVPRKL